MRPGGGRALKLVPCSTPMKPLALSGHERSLTQVKYNHDGDLIFSAAKDKVPSVWYSHNGERLGSYEGHRGTVWTVDPRHDSSLLLTGSSDFSAILWDVETGKNLCHLDEHAACPVLSSVHSVNWSYSGNQFMMTTGEQSGQKSEIRLFNLQDVRTGGPRAMPFQTLKSSSTATNKKQKVTAALWGPLDATVITGHESGEIVKWDVRSGLEISRVQQHTGNINDLQYSADRSMVVAASKDTYCKVFDAEDLSVIQTFRTERPVNSASLSPLKQHIVMGGGQDAMEVTTTSAKVGKFDAAFYHLVYGEEIGRVKGHFGPINTLAFRPDGKQYASGAEDGYIRVHNFDPSYFEFEFEVRAELELDE